MKFYAGVLGVCFVISSIAANKVTKDVHAFLPLFERNSINRKVLDMRFSVICKGNNGYKSYVQHSDVHLVFDAETSKYRRENKYYPDPADTNSYKFSVQVWNEKEYIKWDRVVDGRPGFRVLGHGIYEAPGTAEIRGRPLGDIIIPFDILFLFDVFPRTFAQTVPEQNPTLGRVMGSTITIETERNTFVFSKKTGALEKIDYLDKGKINSTVKLSSHVERSGVWLPLRFIFIEGKEDITEVSVDPKTLRLLDKVEDDSIFSETLPAGCYVNDYIKKTNYTITTLDNPPQDVEALQKVLDKMLDQAEEQKVTVEQKK